MKVEQAVGENIRRHMCEGADIPVPHTIPIDRLSSRCKAVRITVRTFR